METLVTAGLIVAIILALVDEARSNWQGLTTWAVIVGFGVILISRLT